MSQKSRTQSVMGQNQITEGVIWKQLLLFFFPILFGTFFQQLYNTADAVIVGRFVGKEALAAVGGPTGTLINLLVGFFVGLSSGATVIISQFYGAKQPDRVSRAVHTSIAFSIVGGIVLMVIGVAGAPWALSAMGTPDDILNHAVLYMRIYFLGVIGNLIYNMGAGILRAIGDSKRPLYFLIASCFTNIVLDIVFVVFLNMGVIMGGTDAVAVDTICSLVTGWDPESIGYLNLLRENTEAGELESIRVKGAYVDELRKKFTIRKPELGGIQLEAGNGPSLEAEAGRNGDQLEIQYKTGENACKTEIFVDGIFQYSGGTVADGEIQLNIPGLSAGTHEVQIVVYDRFLNKTAKTIEV